VVHRHRPVLLAAIFWGRGRRRTPVARPAVPGGGRPIRRPLRSM